MTKSKQQFRVTLTPVRPRRIKVVQDHRVTDQRVSEFEKKILDLISDPTSQYLTKREVFTKTLVNALHEVQLGLVVS